MSVHGTNPPRLRSTFSFGRIASQSTSSQFNIGYTQLSASGLNAYWLGGEPAQAIDTPGRTMQLSAKRAVDILASLFALILFGPLLLLVTIGIKLADPGPALFRQPRVGLDGRPFTIYKFRSMYLNKCSDDGVAQTVSDDARIMPFGAFLRRTSIDELPQLLNVILGDMSLVGPRPHVQGQLAAGEPYAAAVPYYNYRWAMRPGLTGWAQANGYRGPTDEMSAARARVDHDIAYIQNFSLALDIRIILLTLRREFLRGTGF